MGDSGNQVVDACEKVWPQNNHECNFFLMAVAQELNIVLPVNGTAEAIAQRLRRWFEGKLTFQACTIQEAKHHAGWGRFVVAAATMEQIDKAHQWRVPVSAAAHGHVAVVTRGNGSRGWPRGYWGTHGADGGRNESLSVSFVGKHPEQVDFYVYRVLPPYAPTTLSV